jgi:hypothetical protein
VSESKLSIKGSMEMKMCFFHFSYSATAMLCGKEEMEVAKSMSNSVGWVDEEEEKKNPGGNFHFHFCSLFFLYYIMYVYTGRGKRPKPFTFSLHLIQ